MATRKEYIDKLENQLREWNTQINELQEKANKGSQDLKGRYQKRMETLKTKRGEMRAKLQKIKDSGDGSFDEIKADTEKIWADLKKGFSEIRKIVKK